MSKLRIISKDTLKENIQTFKNFAMIGMRLKILTTQIQK